MIDYALYEDHQWSAPADIQVKRNCLRAFTVTAKYLSLGPSVSAMTSRHQREGHPFLGIVAALVEDDFQGLSLSGLTLVEITAYYFKYPYESLIDIR